MSNIEKKVNKSAVVSAANANLILTVLRNDKNFTKLGQLSKVEIILETSRYIDPYPNRLMISDNMNNMFWIEKENDINVLHVNFDGFSYNYILNSNAHAIIDSLFVY